ncbi:hypothetical protein ACFOX0_33140 [Micromonospora zhanjiangensis]|uniref:Golgi phosphoprotein 3 (GPP34) n=1 Tax=Micromonospora zhanjiangensis TaxID=1522057 RepID=A0ABV8KXT3_9ACTN
MTRALWPLVVDLPGFTAGACRAAGLDVGEAALRDLVRRGLLRTVEEGPEPVFAVPSMPAEAARTALPPAAPDQRDALRDAVVAWFVAHRRPAEALRAVRAAGNPGALARHLRRHGDRLLCAGEVAAVTDAVDSRRPLPVAPSCTG